MTRFCTAISFAYLVLLASSSDVSGSTDPSKCCVEGNLAHKQPTSASSEEANKNNFSKNAVDGDLTTRWCASHGGKGESWQVDLGTLKPLQAVRIHWEASNAAYRYKIETSTDGERWIPVVRRGKNKKVEGITTHVFEDAKARFLKITYLGSSTGAWASIREVEIADKELPKLPEGLVKDPGNLPPTVKDVKAPSDFNVTIFGAPPEVNYPVCLTAAVSGEVFVGVDEQGSLGKKPGGGKVLRCVDTNNDGVADQINVFANVDHPRGLLYDSGHLWVLHPPFLSVFIDEDRDGRSDKQKTLITGVSTDEVNRRGADHTTNGIQLGIDGWIYIAVGDFGFTKAVGADGTSLSKRGGGIVRVRPDGTEMEIYSWGLRNILDVCIDPYMNIFTRDNTNDGGGWDIRLSHIFQTAEYGYPSLYLNFTDEIMPPLADYGGGSGCGGMYLHDLRWPKPYANALYTCDWGRSEVYRHNLPQQGATFKAHQEVFLKLERPTDIDVDAAGRMYVSSWRNGKFKFSGPNVGYIAQILPKGFSPTKVPDLSSCSPEQLVSHLSSKSAKLRLHSQREILNRDTSAGFNELLTQLVDEAEAPLYAKVAAIFTLKQLSGAESHAQLIRWLEQTDLREFALRALTDRTPELNGIPTELVASLLEDADPRVQAQALISLGRLGDRSVAGKILALTERTIPCPAVSSEKPAYKLADIGRVIPHLAVRTLVKLDAVETCLNGLDGPYRDGALWALKDMHSKPAVDGILKRLASTYEREHRLELLDLLARLYYQEAPYKGGWWGTRPDRTGPYYDRGTWDESDEIGTTLKNALKEALPQDRKPLLASIQKHQLKLPGMEDLAKPSNIVADVQEPITLPKVDPKNPNQIANMAVEKAMQRALKTKGDPKKGQALFTQQSCIKCHTFANGQIPKGPHLVDIGKRSKRQELIESILKPSAKIAQGFDTYAFVTVDGEVISGFVVSESANEITLRQANGLEVVLPVADIEHRAKQDISAMPVGVANNLTPEQLADLIAYLESLR